MGIVADAEWGEIGERLYRYAWCVWVGVCGTRWWPVLAGVWKDGRWFGLVVACGEAGLLALVLPAIGFLLLKWLLLAAAKGH